MLIKKIVCDVKTDQQNAFDLAQRQWAPISSVKGFMGQVGGWHGGDAVIFAFWESELAHDYFLKEVHDVIFNQNQQDGTYSSISVTHWHTSNEPMKGQWKNTLMKTDSISLRGMGCNVPVITVQSVNPSKQEILNLTFLPDNHGELQLYDPWTVLPNE